MPEKIWGMSQPDSKAHTWHAGEHTIKMIILGHLSLPLGFSCGCTHPLPSESFRKAAQNMAWLHRFEYSLQQSLQPFGFLLKSHGKPLSTNNLSVTDESG